MTTLTIAKLVETDARAAKLLLYGKLTTLTNSKRGLSPPTPAELKVDDAQLETFFNGEECQLIVTAFAQAVRCRLRLLCKWSATLTGFPSSNPHKSTGNQKEDDEQLVRWHYYYYQFIHTEHNTMSELRLADMLDQRIHYGNSVGPTPEYQLKTFHGITLDGTGSAEDQLTPTELELICDTVYADNDTLLKQIPSCIQALARYSQIHNVPWLSS